jgi:hypothetical protein
MSERARAPRRKGPIVRDHQHSFRRETASRRCRWGLWTAGAVALVLVAGVLIALAPTTASDERLRVVRADATVAFRALHDGDLEALDRALTRNRGHTDFAYYFASKTTARALGDFIATVASNDKNAPLKTEVDAHTYDLALTDLAGTLALATHGTGRLALTHSWTQDFVEATTTRGALYPQSDSSVESEVQRARQDLANRQNLLLLLSRGYWSTDFLKAMTKAYWDLDHDEGYNTWFESGLNDAKYAPGPNGSHLTDGVVALTAALTANPEASRWAFTDFRAGTKTIEGTDRTIGTFAHYLFFEHQFPTSSDGGAQPIGMSASLTALSSAIDATEAGVSIVDALEGDGPTADLVVLRDLATDSTDGSGGSILSKAWDVTKNVTEPVWRWVQHWGHAVLDVLSVLLPGGYGGSAAGINAIWYAIEGDYSNAGLSLASAIPQLKFLKIAIAVKAGTRAQKMAAEAADVAKAAKQFKSKAVSPKREVHDGRYLPLP